MRVGKVAKPIKSMANGGVNLPVGAVATEVMFAPALWFALVDEGAIVDAREVVYGQPEETPEIEIPAEEYVVDVDSLEALKAIADKKGIRYTWNIKKETLKKRIAEAEDA